MRAAFLFALALLFPWPELVNAQENPGESPCVYLLPIVGGTAERLLEVRPHSEGGARGREVVAAYANQVADVIVPVLGIESRPAVLGVLLRAIENGLQHGRYTRQQEGYVEVVVTQSPGALRVHLLNPLFRRPPAEIFDRTLTGRSVVSVPMEGRDLSRGQGGAGVSLLLAHLGRVKCPGGAPTVYWQTIAIDGVDHPTWMLVTLTFPLKPD